MRRKNRNSQQRGFSGRTYRWWKSVLVLVIWMEEWGKKLEEHNRRPQHKHLSSKRTERSISLSVGSNNKKNWEKQISLSQFKKESSFPLPGIGMEVTAKRFQQKNRDSWSDTNISFCSLSLTIAKCKIFQKRKTENMKSLPYTKASKIFEQPRFLVSCL